MELERRGLSWRGGKHLVAKEEGIDLERVQLVRGRGWSW